MSEVPTKRVELSGDRWIEVRTTGTVADVRYIRQQRHERGDYDDETLDLLALVETRVSSWSFGDVPADIGLRKKVLDALGEDDAVKLVMGTKGLDDDRKNAPSSSSSPGTRPRKPRVSRTKPSTSDVETGPSNG